MTTLRRGRLLDEAHHLALPRLAQAEPEGGVPVAAAARPSPEELEQAWRRGYQEGEQAGRLEVEGRLGPVLARAGELLDNLVEARARLLSETEDEIASLALDVAARIVRTELSANPKALLRMVQHGLERLGRRGNVRLRLHPKDLPGLTRAIDGRPSEGALEIVEDPSIEPGGCILESPAGYLDLQPSVQIEEFRRGLGESPNPGAGL